MAVEFHIKKSEVIMWNPLIMMCFLNLTIWKYLLYMVENYSMRVGMKLAIMFAGCVLI